MQAMDFIHQVFLVKVQKRAFDWTMPHQPIFKRGESRGTAFYLQYKKKMHLVTCFHVISDAYLINISSPSIGSKEHVCRVRWICPELDLAVLEVLPPLSSDNIDKQEQPIFSPKHGLLPLENKSVKKGMVPAPPIGSITKAVGFPLGQTHIKITQGILSGQQHGLYQTDAAINGGNSGGPLIFNNKVLGVNARGYIIAQNIAYAIPIQSVLNIIDFHTAHPKIYKIDFPRTWGMEFFPPALRLLPSNKECSIGQNQRCGVEVGTVYPDQLLANTSIKKGDIILSVNSMPISSIGELPITWMKQKMTLFNLLYHIKPGDTVDIEYLSGGKGKKRTEHIVFRPESHAIKYRRWHEEHEKIPFLYMCGIVLVPFNDSIMDMRYSYLHDPKSEYRSENPILFKTVAVDNTTLLTRMQPEHWNKGSVIITNILKGSMMEEAHILKIGELIDSINNKKITSIEDAEKIITQQLKKKEDVLMKTVSNRTIRISPKIFQEEEEKLSKIYNYQSPFHTILNIQPTVVTEPSKKKQSMNQPQQQKKHTVQQQKTHTVQQQQKHTVQQQSPSATITNA